MRGLIIGAVAAGIAAAAALMVFDRISTEQATERRALIARNAELTSQALAPGSALACLEAEVGASVAKACELGVFATPQSLAAAVAFVGERLKVIAAAHAFAPAERLFVAERRAIERDRFGIAAYVLAHGFGCTADKCALFGMLNDTGALKADLAAQPFNMLVARYEPVWDKPLDERVPVAAVPIAPAETKAEPAPARATEALAKAEQPANAPHPLDKKWKLPSADSIPAVSIMMPEPKLPKGEAPPEKPAEQKTAEKAEAPAPLPPKRPQAPVAQPAPAAQPAEAR